MGQVGRGDPFPVSATLILSSRASARALTVSSPPSGMAWTALRHRFHRAWRRRWASTGQVRPAGSPGDLEATRKLTVFEEHQNLVQHLGDIDGLCARGVGRA